MAGDKTGGPLQPQPHFLLQSSFHLDNHHRSLPFTPIVPLRVDPHRKASEHGIVKFETAPAALYDVLRATTRQSGAPRQQVRLLRALSTTVTEAGQLQLDGRIGHTGQTILDGTRGFSARQELAKKQHCSRKGTGSGLYLFCCFVLFLDWAGCIKAKRPWRKRKYLSFVALVLLKISQPTSFVKSLSLKKLNH